MATRWSRALNTACGKARWIPAELLSLCGPVWGIRGGPKHPATVAAATHLRRWLTRTARGPPALSRPTARRWNRMLQWANSEAAADTARSEQRELVWRLDAAEPAARHEHLRHVGGPL